MGAVIVIALAAILWKLFAPAKEAPTVVVEHHRHVTVIERPVYVQAQIDLIRAEIRIADAKAEPTPKPARLPEARLLANPKTAIERYRSHERRPPCSTGKPSS